jgi:sigma-B regulation protein RsbU (phosphoserine phosphatase)
MKILLAEDELTTQMLLSALCKSWDFEPVIAANGDEALQVLLSDNGLHLAVLDWLMPGLSGVEVCRQVRAQTTRPLYLLMLTVVGATESIVEGFAAGADDYVVKPFAHEELGARLNVGRRLVTSHLDVARRVAELEQTLGEVTELKGLLPICVYCKRIRDDEEYWRELEDYVSRHSKVQFTHSVCPQCSDKVVSQTLDPKP